MTTQATFTVHGKTMAECDDRGRQVAEEFYGCPCVVVSSDARAIMSVADEVLAWEVEYVVSPATPIEHRGPKRQP